MTKSVASLYTGKNSLLEAANIRKHSMLDETSIELIGPLQWHVLRQALNELMRLFTKNFVKFFYFYRLKLSRLVATETFQVQCARVAVM